MKGVLLGATIALLIASCVVHRFMGPRLTGTCEGACAHYTECKPGHPDGENRRCNVECPEVFSDRDSLMAFESLSCPDAVEYVEGRAPRNAGMRRR